MQNSEQKAEELQTEALRNFHEKLSRLGAFLDLIHPTSMLSKAQVLARKLANDAKHKQLDKPALEQASADLQEMVNKHEIASGLAHEWMTVMLVAFVEAYLQEGLAFLADKNPNLIKKAEHVEYRRVLEINTIEELRAEIRMQWASSKLTGGPGEWMRHLKQQFGAPDYDSNVTKGLEFLWDTRNEIVHAQGRTRPAYVRKYAALGLKAGDPIIIDGLRFKDFLETVGSFVYPMDTFFIRYKWGEKGAT